MSQSASQRWSIGGRSPATRQLLLATGLALVLAVVTYVVARTISGDLLVDGRRAATPVPLGAVAAATVAGGLAARAIIGLAHRTRMPRRTFLALVAAGFVASSAAPAVGATTATTAAWLLLMHLVVAVPIVAASWRLVSDAP